VKPLEEKNSSIAKELGMTVATAKTEFLWHSLRERFQIWPMTSGSIFIAGRDREGQWAHSGHWTIVCLAVHGEGLQHLGLQFQPV
jgi:hypothetical protein